jgi:FKBP-type peptidyl-prolyl cis-trans isomerase (trigger factor)
MITFYDTFGTSVLDQENSVGTSPAVTPPQYVHFRTVAISSHLYKVSIEIDSFLTNLLRQQTLVLYQNMQCEGFENKAVPTQLIQELYELHINKKLKNYFFHHIVLDFLLGEMYARRTVAANYPRLISVDISPEQQISYSFDVSIADDIELKEWKHFAFKSPKRKRYKDLDKQVIAFVDNRQSLKKMLPHVVEENDWVFFEAKLVDNKGAGINEAFVNHFWIKVGNQEATEAFVSQLLSKTLSSSFFTTDLVMHPDDAQENVSFRYLINIKEIIKGGHFLMEIFKNNFKLKNKAEIHNKLMEVFSYRNDISQRKAIIEEVFHLLLSKHRFEVPKHLVLRREEIILKNLSRQPDYHVYKTQKDFNECVELLAEKQLKEEILIDQIGQRENIRADSRDVHHYLHLFSNKRLKEFIYFKPLTTNLDEIEIPVNVTTLLQAVTREKTMNFIIHTLTK